jgi:nucleotide-binding universal stress UspA family protein
MYQHLLIATDGSDLAQKAVAQGLALAASLRARVTALHVTEPWVAVVGGEMSLGFPVAEYESAAAARAESILSGVRKAAEAAGVTCETLHVKDQFPAEGIIETAKSRGCDLIMMASHGYRGLTRFLLGSEANRVVTHSAIPVLICR